MKERLDFDVFRSTFRYTLLQTFRQLNAGWFLGLQVIGPIFLLLTSWTILQIVGSSTSTFTALSGYADYIPFAILGFAFSGVIMNTVWAGANGIRSEQQGGTVEAIFVTPSNKVAWMLGKIAGSITVALTSTVIVLIVGSVLLSFTLSASPDLLSAAVGVFLTLVGMTAFAFAIAGLTFLAKRVVDDINQILWTSLVFFTGLAFPIEALPPWAQTISWVFPITHGLTITRSAVLKGYSIFDQRLLFPVTSILILSAIYIPLGYFSFRAFLDRARKKGALEGY